MDALGEKRITWLCGLLVAGLSVVGADADDGRWAPTRVREPVRTVANFEVGWSAPRIPPTHRVNRADYHANTGRLQSVPPKRLHRQTFFERLTAPPAANPSSELPKPIVASEDALPPCEDGVCETWQVLPPGLLFRSYLAGEKEPRMGTSLLFETGGDTLQESTIGARLGLVRYGTVGAIRPEGWQLDFEGAALLRQNWTHSLDVDAVDFRFGIPITWRRGPWAAKFAYYHLSSHVGDEFLGRNPGFRRVNYIRDAIVAAVSYDITCDWLVYAEAAFAFHTDGGAEPWEFQFGVEYSPIERNGFRGTPFFAINGHLREEFNFGGSVNAMAGWQWRSEYSDVRLRFGAHYYNGKSMQYSFFNQHEELIGLGLWYDF